MDHHYCSTRIHPMLLLGAQEVQAAQRQLVAQVALLGLLGQQVRRLLCPSLCRCHCLCLCLCLFLHPYLCLCLLLCLFLCLLPCLFLCLLLCPFLGLLLYLSLFPRYQLEAVVAEVLVLEV